MLTKVIIDIKKSDRVFVADAEKKTYYEATVLESEKGYISVDAGEFSSLIKKIVFDEEGISTYEAFTYVETWNLINYTTRYFIILISDVIKYDILKDLKNVENCIFENNFRLKGKLLERKKFSFTVDFGDNYIVEYFNNGQCVTNLRDCVTVTEEADMAKVLNVLNVKDDQNLIDEEFERRRTISLLDASDKAKQKIVEKEKNIKTTTIPIENTSKLTLTKMENSKMKDITSELKVKGIENAKFVAKIALGKSILDGVNKQIKKKLPLMVRGYYDEYHAISDMVISSVLSVAGKNYYGNSKKLNLILESVELAALADGGNKGAEVIASLLRNVKIPEILQDEIEDDNDIELSSPEQEKTKTKNK